MNYRSHPAGPDRGGPDPHALLQRGLEVSHLDQVVLSHTIWADDILDLLVELLLLLWVAGQVVQEEGGGVGGGVHAGADAVLECECLYHVMVRVKFHSHIQQLPPQIVLFY